MAQTPAFTNLPAAQAVNVGAPVSFSAAATGPGPLQYQWLKNSVPIAGATETTFTLASAHGRDAGKYTLAVTNSSGTVSTPPVDLIVASGYAITTLAGSPREYGTADGAGSSARFYGPWGIALDPAGNLVVADRAFDRVRRITPAGLVQTIASATSLDVSGQPTRFDNLESLAVDGEGNIYIADVTLIWKITPAGSINILAGARDVSGTADGAGSTARFIQVAGLAADRAGHVYVADAGGRIRKISPQGEVTTLAGIAGGRGHADGLGPSARFNSPQGLAVDATGNVYVADHHNNAVRKVTPEGVVTTLAGLPGSQGSEDGIGTTARFTYPRGIAVDAAGNIYVSDDNHTVRKITPAGTVTTIAGLARAAGTADGVGPFARFDLPYGIAVDPAGTVYISDYGNHTIRHGARQSDAFEATTITAPPLSFEAVSGHPMTLQVVATGTAPFTYQWLKDGMVIAGATGPSLHIDRAEASTAGDYAVVVTGDGGAVTSAPAAVTLHPDTASPIFRAQPSGEYWIKADERLYFQVGVTGRPTPSLQWYRNGTLLEGATGLNYTVPRAQAADGGTYSVTARNAAGETTSIGFSMTVRPRITRIFTTPTQNQFPTGSTVVLKVEAVAGASAPTYRWLKNRVPIMGAGTDTLVLTNVQGRDSGSYVVVVANGSDSATSDAIQVTVQSGHAPPVITVPPAHASVTVGDSAAFAANVTGPGPFSYQWLKDDMPLTGVTGATLGLANVQPADGGNYAVVVTGPGGAVTSHAGFLHVQPRVRLANLSIRTLAGGGSQMLIAGFVVAGPAKRLLVRGIGPALADFGIRTAILDPRLELFAGDRLVLQNDNWSDGLDPTPIAAAGSRLGAFPLNAGAKDAVLLGTMQPGAYTAQISAAGGAPGIGLVELYDADAGGDGEGRLVNVSARAHVGTGENILVAGFVVGGVGSKTVLIRAVGPALAGFGVADALADPHMELYRYGTVIGMNDNWSDQPEANAIRENAVRVGAFPIPVGGRDAAMIATLSGGVYTVQISGVAASTGVALIEIYDVP